MALLTKAAFAKLAGITTSNVTQYISRHKIAAINDLIDDQDPKNIYFLEKRITKQKLDQERDVLENEELDTSISEQFKDELDDKFLWHNNTEYIVEKEKDMLLLNANLPEGNKLIPRMILDNMANGSLIDLCKVFLEREINLRRELDLSLRGVKNYYDLTCRQSISDLKNGISELMDDIEDEYAEDQEVPKRDPANLKDLNRV